MFTPTQPRLIRNAHTRIERWLRFVVLQFLDGPVSGAFALRRLPDLRSRARSGFGDICVVRVTERLRRGSHYVPEADVRRRFTRSCDSFWHIYREIADQWTMFYNAGADLIEVAFGAANDITVSDNRLFERFREQLEADRDG